ncbi:MAG: hypothetical protein AABX17_02640 [Nanoarchaeota archaeon]
MITIDEFQKIDLRVGEIRALDKGKIKINCLNKEFSGNLKLNAVKGDELIVVFNAGKLVIPVVNGDIPLIPEKKIENGSKVR